LSKPSITAVLESYGAVNLPDYGGWHAIKCPFHNDRRASASVNPDEGVFRCHACEIKGDAYAVVMQTESIAFPEAKQRVQALTGVTADERDVFTGSHRGGQSKLPAWTKNRKRKRVFA
jgi:DNA primase